MRRHLQIGEGRREGGTTWEEEEQDPLPLPRRKRRYF